MEKRKFQYTKSGKLLRGFGCLAAFAVFLVCACFILIGMSLYETNIIDESQSDYFKTQSYQQQVLYCINNATGHLLTMNDETNKDEVSVIDVARREVYTYDIEKMYHYFLEDPEYTDNLESYNAFRKSYKNISDMDLSDYYSAREFLKNNAYEDSFIFFDDTSFRSLFIDQGLQNIDHRFSYDFGEDAYFLFDFQGKNKTAAKTLEKIKKCDKEESVGEKFDLTDIDYAVYDDSLFYSTEDDYFDEYACYVYRVKDIRDLLEELDPEQTRYDSIVFGLLKSENLNFTWIDEPYYAYGSTISAKNILNDLFNLDKTGDFYYFAADGKEDCSEQDILDKAAVETDVKTKEKIVENYLKDKDCIYYSFYITNSGKIESTTNGVPFEYKNQVKEMFQDSSIKGDGIFIYAFYNGPKVLEQTGTHEYARQFRFFAKNAKSALGFGILGLIITVLLAASLIKTTGRKYKGDKEVSLNIYDRLYGELWWMITGTVLCMTFGVEYSLFIVNLSSISDMIGALIHVAVYGVIFALLVMLFVLSLCRRIKARLLFKNSLCVKLFKKLWTGFKKGAKAVKDGTLTRVKGTRRLVLIYSIFAIANFLTIWICYDAQAEGMILISLCLQIIGLFGVIFLVRDTNRLIGGVAEIVKGDLDYKVQTDEKFGIYKELTNNINHIGDGLKAAIETSLKDERMKTELITNVSHDLKTPLTSIISYIELLKKEEMVSEDAKHYVEVIDGKAQRLKQLTEDLVEAAKATSGNVELHMMPIDFNELMRQAIGEYEEKFAQKQLEIVAGYPGEVIKIEADGRRLYRVLENVLQNVCKYAMPKTRVYIDLLKQSGKAVFTVKNVSDAPLNISPEELMERFTRGDEARTTEGSGLGLSIAKDLTSLQGGTFNIVLDGDLFKVIIEFMIVE